MSFAVIAGYWLAHFRLFASFVAVDIRIIVMNLVLLAAIVVLPFTTEYAGDPNINHLPLPIAVVSVNIAAVSGAFTAVYVIGVRPRSAPARTLRRGISASTRWHCSCRGSSSSPRYRSPT